MEIVQSDEIINIKNNSKKKIDSINNVNYLVQIICFFIIILFFFVVLYNLRTIKLSIFNISYKPINVSHNHKKNKIIKIGHELKDITDSEINSCMKSLLFESKMLHLSEFNKRRTFEKRYPLPKEINCYEHMREGGLIDLMAFTSFLKDDTIFFEFGSGCTSVIAKYYAKKSYAVEGNFEWYERGVNNGLKNNILFRDIKPKREGKLWSTPGPDSKPENWQNYFQAYKKEYNADVIFIDGRFRVACAFDIFDKIKDDTIILIHEYFRPQYLIIEKYYEYIHHWGSLFMFIKKKGINEIPLDFQKLYWNDSA